MLEEIPPSRRQRAGRLVVVALVGVFMASGVGMMLHDVILSLAVAPPNIIPYQGRVLDTNGVPVAAASADMQFRLYDSLVAGTCLWSNDSATCASNADLAVTLTDGLFSENLGDTSDGYAAISDSVFADDASVYLEVQVEGETLSPRKRIGASAYALNAGTLDGLDSGDIFQQDGNSFGVTATIGTNDAEDFAIETDGTTRMTVLSTGEVGLGTATPFDTFSIEGSGGSTGIGIDDSSLGAGGNTYLILNHIVETDAEEMLLMNGDGSTGLTISNQNTGTGNADLTDIPSSANFYTSSTNSGGLILASQHATAPMIFATGGVATGNERMRIDSAGNVGIGTATPGETLEVSGTAYVSGHAAMGADAVTDDLSLLYPGDTVSNILNVSERMSDASVDYVEGITNYLLYDPSADSSAVGIYGLDSETFTDAGNSEDVNYIAGSYFYVNHQGTGDIVSWMSGVWGEVATTATSGSSPWNTGGFFRAVMDDPRSSGTELNAGIWSAVGRTGATGGTIDNYGVYIENNGVDAAGAGTSSLYGLYLEDMTGADTNYSIYSAGGQSYFADNVGIGTAAPGEMLEVSGTAYVSGHVAIGADASVNDGSLLYPGNTFNNVLNVSETITDASVDAVEGITDYLVYDPSADASGVSVYVMDAELSVPSSNGQDIDTLVGGEFATNFEGTGTLATNIGIQGLADHFGSGTVTTSFGGYFAGYDSISTYGMYALSNHSSGTVAGTSYGGYLDSYSVTAVSSGTDNTYGVYSKVRRTGATGGTINTYGYYLDNVAVDNAGAGTSNFYGLYLESITGADTNYAIYSAGGQSYHAGNFGIGATSPDADLDIEAAEDTERVRLTDTSNADSAGIYVGDGTAGLDGTLSAQAGSIFLDEDGKLWVNVDGATNWDEVAYSTGAVNDLDGVYDTDSDKVLAIDNVAGLKFDAVSGDFTVRDSGSVTFATFTTGGNVAFENDVDLGSSTADTISMNGRLDTGLVPTTDGTLDLGSTSNRWGDLWLDGATLHVGDATDDEFTLAYNAATNLTSLNSDGAAGEIAFLSADTERVRIDGSGNVGIGTASPGQQLDVQGTADTAIRVKTTSGITDAALELDRNVQGNARSIVRLQTGGVTDWFFGLFNYGAADPGGSDLQLSSTGQSDGNSQFTFTKTGRIGIGTDDPSQMLSIGASGTPLEFEGATANGFETTFAIADPTADRTVTFQDASGTVAFMSDLSSFGDITAVGSMASGDTFAGTGADDDWLGLGSGAGRIEFDDQATDEVNILSANVGIGTSTPGALLAVGSGDKFKVNSDGDVTSSFTQLDGTDLANGAGAATTTLVLDDTTGFNAGNYVLVNSTYAKIVSVDSGTNLTISPALTWSDNDPVDEYHVPEIGGTDTASTLANRYGRGYFIDGVVTGNGSTRFSDNLIDTTANTLNFNTGNNRPVTFGTGLVTLGGNLAVTGTITSGGAAAYVNGGNSFAAAAILGTNDSNTLAFETNNTTRLTIDTSGNVGIGDATPAAMLSVGATSQFTVDSSGNVDTSGTMAVGSTSTFSGLLTLDTDTGADAVFGEASIERTSASDVAFSITNSGAGTIDGSIDGFWAVGTGSASFPGFTFNGDYDSGLYSNGTGAISISDDGTTSATFTFALATLPGDLAVNGDDITSDGSLSILSATGTTLNTTAGAITLQPAGSGTTSSVQVGAGGAGSTTPDTFLLDVKSSAGDPTGANGAMYYNASSATFRCYENSTWKDCIGTGGSGDITSVGDVTSGAAFDGTAGNSLQFEGSSADGFETTLTAADPGADYTVTIPAATVTLNAAGDLSGTTLNSGVTASSLTAVGALASGSIASGFGTISTGNTITTTGTMGTAGTTSFTGGTGTFSGNFSAAGLVLSLGDAVTDGLTVSAAIQGSSALVFDGATNDANETTFSITDPTADRTITFQNGSGTVAFTSDIPAAGANTALSNLSGVAINTSLLPASDDSIDLGSSSLRWRDLYLGPATLHIGTSASAEGTITYTDTTQDVVGFGSDATGNADIAFFTDDLYLDKSAGFVGIGDTTPSAMLSVGATSQFQVDSSGNITTSGTLAVNGGIISATGSLVINSQTTSALTLDSGTGGDVNLGTGTTAKTVNIGTGAATANTINIGGTGANTIAIGNTQTGGSVAVGAAMTTGTITIGGTGAQTGTIGIGTGTGAQTINLGTGGTAAKTVTLGSTASTSSLTLNSGTGAINIGTSVGKAITIGNTSSGTSMDLKTGPGSILNVGNDGASKTINIGSATVNSADIVNIATQSTAQDEINIGNANSLTTLALTGGTAWSVSTAGLITTASDVAVNGGDITSTGILDLQPASGSNLTVTLATTGDFVVNTNDLFVDTSLGYVGIGDNSPSYQLDVSGDFRATGFVYVGLSAVGSDTAVCSSLANGTTPTDGTAYILRDCNTAPAADYMEMYPVEGTVATGDLVVNGATVVTTDDGDDIRQLVKSSSPYQGGFVGVASDPANESDFNTIGYNIDAADNPYPVALVGRVLVKVSDENGAIAPGDAVTTSSTAGVGMKATQPGMIVGYALDDFAGPGQGTVMVFIAPGFEMGGAVEQGPTGEASSGTPGIDSFGLSLRGSGWDGAAAQERAMKLVTAVADASSYKLSVRNQADTEVAYVSDDGAFSAASDVIVGGKLYPSALGVAQTDKYVYYGGSGDDFMRTNATGWGTGSYDFAEMFPSSQELLPGDVVAFDTASQQVKKASGDDRTRLAGIVSTRPGFLAGDKKEGDSPIALAGRVPTNVSVENGPIAVGDALTVSETRPGYAMKATEAGMIVGYALEDVPEDGSAIVFVHLGYWTDGTQPAAGTDNAASGFSPSNVSSLSMNGNVYMQGNSILDVGAIAGLGGIWSVDSEGTFRTEGNYKTVIESYQGEKVETTAVTSPDVQVTLVGTATLENGVATISFESASPSFNDITSTTAPVRVLVTPSGPVSLYVEQKDHNGFTVRQVGGSDSGVTFDWMVSAFRKGYEGVGSWESGVGMPVDEQPPAEDPPVVEEPPVEPPVPTDTVPTDPAPVPDPVPPAEPAPVPTEVPAPEPPPADQPPVTTETPSEPAP